MKVGAILLLALIGITPILAKNFGTITIGGANRQVYVVGRDWVKDFLTMNANGITLHGGGGFHFATQPNDGWDPNMFWQIPLDNKHFSYKIDVSNVGCHCNAATYFVKMPSGSNPGESGDYYCDANFGNGIWCPEYDTFEGNKHTMAGNTAYHVRILLSKIFLSRKVIAFINHDFKKYKSKVKKAPNIL